MSPEQFSITSDNRIFLLRDIVHMLANANSGSASSYLRRSRAFGYYL